MASLYVHDPTPQNRASSRTTARPCANGSWPALEERRAPGHRRAERGRAAGPRARRPASDLDLLLVDLRTAAQLRRRADPDRPQARRRRLPILVFSGTVSSAEEVRELAALGVAGYINEYSAVQHILPSLAPHLFPDNFNRRGSPRRGARHPGRPIASGATIAAALYAEHLRAAASPSAPPARSSAMTEVKLRFRLPGSKKDFDLDAHVRWSDPRAGMGLQFTASMPPIRPRSTSSWTRTSPPRRAGPRPSTPPGPPPVDIE